MTRHSRVESATNRERDRKDPRYLRSRTVGQLVTVLVNVTSGDAYYES